MTTARTSEKVPTGTVSAGDLADLIAGSTGDKTLKTAVISGNTAATISIVAAVTGKRIKVYAITLVSTSANTINFENGTTDVSGVMAFGANGGMVATVNPPAFLFATTAGSAFQMTLGSAAQVSGWVAYWDDDAE